MADTAYLNAQRRREEIAKEINDHQAALEAARAELVRVDNFLKEWRRFAGVDDADTVDATEPAKRPPLVRLRPIVPVSDRPKNPTKEEVGDVVERMIEAKGWPIPRRDLSEKLPSEGIHLHGKDREMVLSTMLWRMQDRFIRIPNHGYWLRNKPHERLGYDPSHPEDVAVAKPSEDAERRSLI